MKSTASAAGGAVPAASPTSRRALLGALAASPLVGALALPALAEAAAEIPTGAIAAAPHPDAAMFVLRDRLAEAYERVLAALDRRAIAEDAMAPHTIPRPGPPAIELRPGYEEWGRRMREAADQYPRLSDEEDRQYEAALKRWEARKRRWKRKTGLRQAEAEVDRLWAEYHGIADEMQSLPAHTLAGLKA